jgi:hypothetical protein
VAAAAAFWHEKARLTALNKYAELGTDRNVQLALLNPVLNSTARRDLRVAADRSRQALAAYGVPGDPNWLKGPLVSPLPPADRERLADNVAGMLLTWAEAERRWADGEQGSPRGSADTAGRRPTRRRQPGRPRRPARIRRPPGSSEGGRSAEAADGGGALCLGPGTRPGARVQESDPAPGGGDSAGPETLLGLEQSGELLLRSRQPAAGARLLRRLHRHGPRRGDGILRPLPTRAGVPGRRRRSGRAGRPRTGDRILAVVAG